MFKNLTFFSGKYKEGEKSVVKQIFFLSFFNYGYQTLIFLTSPDVLISETLYFVIILLFFFYLYFLLKTFQIIVFEMHIIYYLL